ncbi:MAG TPA: DMT family transporter [Anaerolineales bacterium]|nr:DMT family transporter [Anaerolineales bacterium]
MTGALWATISGIGFGFFQAFNRRAGQAFDAYFSTFVLIAISALILAGASVLTEDLGRLNGLPLMTYVNFALAGLIHFFLGWTLLTVSQNKIGAARTGALSGTSPLFALFISALAFNEFLRAPVLGGILMLVAGVYLVSFDKNPLAGASGKQWLDSMYGLGVAVCFSISPIFIRGGLEILNSPLLGVTIGMSFSALAYGITLFFRRSHLLQGVLTSDAIIYQLAASVFVGFSTWTRWVALDEAPVSVVLALGRLNVPVVILLSPILVGSAQENVTLRVWIGAILIVSGSLILNFYG